MISNRKLLLFCFIGLSFLNISFASSPYPTVSYNDFSTNENIKKIQKDNSTFYAIYAKKEFHFDESPLKKQNSLILKAKSELLKYYQEKSNNQNISLDISGMVSSNFSKNNSFSSIIALVDESKIKVINSPSISKVKLSKKTTRI